MNYILKEKIYNKQKIKDYFFNIIIIFISISFITIGLSSYFKYKFFLTTKIVFLPQGVTMFFYGLLGVIITTKQIINIYCKIGEGYNKFDKKKKKIRIFRKLKPYKKKKHKNKY